MPEDAISLSIERNMKCAVDHCGHGQLGHHVICKKDPGILPPRDVALTLHFTPDKLMLL